MILSVEKFNYNLEPEKYSKILCKEQFYAQEQFTSSHVHLVVVLTSFNAASALLLFNTKKLIILLFCMLTNNMYNFDKQPKNSR